MNFPRGEQTATSFLSSVPSEALGPSKIGTSSYPPEIRIGLSDSCRCPLHWSPVSLFLLYLMFFPRLIWSSGSSLPSPFCWPKSVQPDSHTRHGCGLHLSALDLELRIFLTFPFLLTQISSAWFPHLAQKWVTPECTPSLAVCFFLGGLFLGGLPCFPSLPIFTGTNTAEPCIS